MTKKQIVGEKGLFGLDFHIPVHHQRKSRQELKQGRNLEAGADAMRSAACSACFLYRTQDHQPRDGTTHKWLDPPLSITN